MQRKISIILSLALLLGCMPFDTVSAEKIFSWIIEPSMVYDNIYSFRDGLAGVRRGGDELRGEATDFYYNNYHGVINDQGKEIIPPSEGNPQYGWDSSIEGGYVLLPKDGETTVYTYDGDIVSVLPYEQVEYFDKNIFEVKTDEAFMVCDIYNNAIISVPKELDYCSVIKLGDSLIEMYQTKYNYSKKKIDIYDYQGNCIIGDLDNIHSYYNDESQKYTYAVIKDGKYALIDDNANLLTEPIYDTLEKTSEGTLKVSKDDKYGILTMDGSVIVPCQYEAVEKKEPENSSADFAGISYIVSRGGQYGLFDIQGNHVVPDEYASIEIYRTDVACCTKEERTDFIGIHGNILYSGPENSAVYSVEKVTDGLYKAPCGLINDKGECLLESESIIFQYVLDMNNIVFARVNSGGLGLEYVLFNIENGSQMVLEEYTSISEIPDSGMIAVQKNGIWGTINSRLETVIPFEYENIYKVTNNTFLRVMKNSKYGIADYSGNIIVPCEYDSLYADESWGSYYKNRIKGTKDGATYYGYIDDDNKLVVPCIYDDVYKSENGFIVESGGLEGIIGLDGTAVTDIIYENISFFKEQYIIFRQNGLNGLLDMNGDILLPPVYDSIDSGGKDRFLVHYQGKYGILNRYGDIILPIEYDAVYFQEPGGGNYSAYYDGCLCIFYKDTDTDGIKDTCGLMDPNGSIFLDCEYEEIYTDSEIIRAKDKNGLWGLARIEEKMPVMVETAPENGMLKVSIENSGNYQGKLIAVFYQNGQYIETEQREIQSGIYEEQFTVPQEADSYKVFVWDSLEGMEPLSFSQSGELSGS